MSNLFKVYKKPQILILLIISFGAIILGGGYLITNSENFDAQAYFCGYRHSRECLKNQQQVDDREQGYRGSFSNNGARNCWNVGRYTNYGCDTNGKLKFSCDNVLRYFSSNNPNYNPGFPNCAINLNACRFQYKSECLVSQQQVSDRKSGYVGPFDQSGRRNCWNVGRYSKYGCDIYGTVKKPCDYTSRYISSNNSS